LIGIAMPRIKGMQEQANITKAQMELKTIQLAIESYYINKNNTYPDTDTKITNTLLGETGIPQILSEILLDPFSTAGEEYKYKKSDDGNYYVIYSVGLDGSEGTTNINDGGTCDLKDDGGLDNIWVTNGSDCVL